MDEGKTATLDAAMLAELGGEEAVDRTPVFIVLGGPNAGELRDLSHAVVVGRGQDANWQISDDQISRQHLRLVPGGGSSVQLVDLGSTNGTFCNGQKVTGAVDLKDGDVVRLGGSTVLKFSYKTSMELDFHRRQYESATRDPLTGLHNRQALDSQIPREIAMVRQGNGPLSVAMLDIDHFKKVNDTHGHVAGDCVLSEVGSLLIRQARASDFPARFGGEEFIILLRVTPAAQALIAAERIRAAIAAMEISHDGVRMPVTASIGLATLENGHYRSPTDLLQIADANLYRAKQEGRNRVVSDISE